MPVIGVLGVISLGCELVVDDLRDGAVLVTAARVVPWVRVHPFLCVIYYAWVWAGVGVLLADLLHLLLLLPQLLRLVLRLVAQTHRRCHVVTVTGLDCACDDRLGLLHVGLSLRDALVDGVYVAGKRVALDYRDAAQ